MGLGSVEQLRTKVIINPPSGDNICHMTITSANQ